MKYRNFMAQIVLGLVITFSLLQTGCVALLGNEIKKESINSRQAVVLDGQIFVVNVDSGEVMRLPDTAADEAVVFEEIVIEEEHDDDH